MKDLNAEFYRKMYLIRRAEEKIQEHYPEDEMKTPMHMSMGEEAIVAGVCHALKPTDQVLGSYRSHALYLAKTMETDRFFAEMYGKATGIAKGKAGSMHLIEPTAGLICTSAVVASHIPVAVGAAFANKMRKTGKLIAAFFGDGALDEGAFWESLNAACLMKLPVLFVCEDNGYAVHSPAFQRHGYKAITNIVSGFDCNTFESDSTDAEAIYNLTKDAMNRMKENDHPCFLHLKYYRYLEHVGVSQDFKADYRPYEEFERWYKVDPIHLQRKKLLRMIPEKDISRIENEINEQIERSLLKAQKAVFPETSTLCEDVYS